jgi:hypothetical protein
LHCPPRDLRVVHLVTMMNLHHSLSFVAR